jgi:hypothetical protein
MLLDALLSPSLLSPVLHLPLLDNSKSDTSGIGGAKKILDATPFLLATLYYLLTPFFTELVRRGLVGYLNDLDAEWQGPDVSRPPHLTPQAIASNIDWIVDAPQMVPTLLLPLAGAILALTNGDIVSVILSFSVLLVAAAALWIYTRSPVQYRSFRLIKHRYTIVSILGIALNAGTAALLLST